MNDSWQSGDAYERYMGRWSSLVAEKILKWLDVPFDKKWLDVGCGTGSFTKLILDSYQPREIVGIDSSAEFVSYAQLTVKSPIVHFMVDNAEALKFNSESFDAAVSGLVLNFVPEPETALQEMKRVTIPGGKIGIYLWDYAKGMQMLRYFWDAARAVDPKAKKFDEAIRFPICKKEKLGNLLEKVGLQYVEEISIEVETLFKNFNDYWEPLFGGVGPAPAYVMSLKRKNREELEHKLRGTLPINADGSISLKARAWAAKGIVLDGLQD